MLRFDRPATFLVDENGTKNSTRMKAIAVDYGFNAEGGSKNFNFATTETHSCLADHIGVVKGVRQPSDSFITLRLNVLCE